MGMGLVEALKQAENYLAKAEQQLRHMSTLTCYSHTDSVCTGNSRRLSGEIEAFMRELRGVRDDVESLQKVAEDAHEAAHRKFMTSLAEMDDRQKRQTLIDAGILKENGDLADVYAELAAPVEPKPQWFRDDFGEMAYWDVFALMVGTWEGDGTQWRWSVVGRLVDSGLLAHGYVANVEEAKAHAFEAAQRLRS